MKTEELTEKQREKLSEFGVNTWFVMELLEEYLNNPDSVGEDWQKMFRSLDIKPNGGERTEAVDKRPAEKPKQLKVQAAFPQPAEGDEAVPVKGAGERVLENMTDSLSIPSATSLRTIPVKVLEENRRLINQYFKKHGGGKISYTHIIGWAIVKAVSYVRVINDAFTIIEGKPHVLRRKDVNLGVAIDLEKRDGTRSLIVPNIKKANNLSFKEYFDA